MAPANELTNSTADAAKAAGTKRSWGMGRSPRGRRVMFGSAANVPAFCAASQFKLSFIYQYLQCATPEADWHKVGQQRRGFGKCGP
jgi:hypothetical protein